MKVRVLALLIVGFPKIAVADPFTPGRIVAGGVPLPSEVRLMVTVSGVPSLTVKLAPPVVSVVVFGAEERPESVALPVTETLTVAM
jgi:hypothetical protein